MSARPRRITADLPGTGGALKLAPEDFLVEELPAYLPCGEGGHTYLFIEKRGLTTEEALQRLCRGLGVRRDDAGAAGMKDRQAITRQWVSLPAVDPDAALALSTSELRILEARRHGNKLRTGHLRGNRFTITVRGTRMQGEEARARAQEILDALVQRGMPNRYGAQRFGARGDNAGRGRALITDGEARTGGRRLGRGEKRLYISAFQSELFNAYLDARIDDGLLRQALPGDVLRRRDSGGLFVVSEAELAEAQGRLDGAQLDVTGPMFGPRMIAPQPGTPAATREDAILTDAGITIAQLGRLGGLAEGTRRPLTVAVEGPSVRLGEAADAIVVSFALPSGAYATVLLDEVVKPEGSSP
jgi:tRNA pseudouridine13 synthase